MSDPKDMSNAPDGAIADAPDQAPKPTRINFLAEYARRQFGMSAAWDWYRWERIGAGLHVSGGICDTHFASGKYKGQKNWKSKKRNRTSDLSFVVSNTAYNDFLLLWERETGRCHECQGTTEQWCGWSQANGNSYRPCRRCNATGLAPQADQGDPTGSRCAALPPTPVAKEGE